MADLKVHVAIGADEEALVFEPPLETDKHRLPGQLLQERLWIDRCDLSQKKRIPVYSRNKKKSGGTRTAAMVVSLEGEVADFQISASVNYNYHNAKRRKSGPQTPKDESPKRAHPHFDFFIRRSVNYHRRHRFSPKRK